MKTAAFALAAHSPFAAALSQPLQSPPSLEMGLPPSCPCVGACSGPCSSWQNRIAAGVPMPQKRGLIFRVHPLLLGHPGSQ